MNDALDLNNFKVPKYHLKDCSDLCSKEEEEYQSCANELIEIQIGAKEGLEMIRSQM